MLTTTAEGIRTAIVADDQAAMRLIINEALTRHGYRVTECADGQSAVDLLKSHQWDLLVSDIRMPGVTGLEVVEAAREISPATTCVLVTGDSCLKTAREAAQKGAFDYLPKPFSIADLIEAVDAAVARKAKQRAISREQELTELFRLSEDARSIEDPWEMLRVTSTTAVIQTGSDLGCLATLRDGRLAPFMIGAGSAPDELREGHLLHDVAREQQPMLLTTDDAEHPLADLVPVVGPDRAVFADGVSECLAFPLCDGKSSYGAVAVARLDPGRPYSKGDYQLMSVLSAQCGLLLKNADLVESLQRAYVGTVQAMARAMEARDEYTHGHSQRVAAMCRKIAGALAVSPEDAEVLEMAAGLHDVGKIAVPDRVLNKPGRLTDDEWASIRAHPVIGAEVLRPAKFLHDAVPLVLHHHERYDGRGYPDGVNNGDLNELTHIIMGADAYDAMTSDRPYREALSVKDAVEELNRCRGSQFAPEIVDAMTEVLLGVA